MLFCTHPLEETQLAQRGRALLTNFPPSLFPAKAKTDSKHFAATHTHTHTEMQKLNDNCSSREKNLMDNKQQQQLTSCNYKRKAINLF